MVVDVDVVVVGVDVVVVADGCVCVVVMYCVYVVDGVVYFIAICW